MKLDHRDGHIHRGGSSDGGGSSGGLKVPQQHADSEPLPGHTTPTTPHPTADPHPPGAAPEGETSVCDMMASRLSHLDRMANWREVWNPRLSMSLASTKGLMNAPGDNNCFLNSAVQVLWHLDVFRRSFRLLSGHACMGNGCIFCTLKVLFTQLQYSDRSTLPPDALRRALASSFQDQHRFQLGHMDDAAECFENILTRIHYHIANETSEDSCKQLHCIPHQKFAMNIVEQILCQCGATTEPLPFTQMVHYVSANALVSQAKLLPMKRVLRADCLGRQTCLVSSSVMPRRRETSGTARNCGEKVKIRKSLMNTPDVVSIGLIWDSDRPTLDHIKDVVRSIGTTIRLPDLFHSVSDVHGQHPTTLHLVGVVCYYGKHYSTFFFHSKMKKWVYFDDAHVKEMGPAWNNVADKCCRGHYQPLLLLYANPDCEPVETHTAPDVTTKLPGYQHFNSGVGQDGNNGEHRPRRKDVPPSRQQQYGQYESGRRAQAGNPNLRRSMTPGPEQRHLEQHSIPRRAITPGPEYGRYNSDEDETDAPAGVAHFRQSSYLIAVDGTPGAPGSGDKMPRSKTATHGGDPYFSAQRADVHAQSRPVQNGIHQARQNNVYGQNAGSHAGMTGQQGYPQGQYQGQPQGRPQGHSQRPVQGQERPVQGQHGHSGTNGQQYQYVAPQTHPPPVAQKPRTTQAPPREQHPQASLQHQPQQQQQQQQQQLPKPSEYQDWTLSTSEPYRRQNMPKSPEPKAPESRGPEPTESTGFVYPTSPSKNKTTPSLAKVNEIQRLESFKKGKAIGADVIRYQISPTEKPTTSANPYGPLDPEALYPGHESGVMQAPKGVQPIVGRMPTSQSHPALKSEVVVQQHQQQQGPHTTNLKRTRSLENTADQGPGVGGQHPTAVVHQSGAVTTGRTRPHSARPFENGQPPQQQVPPTTPKLGPKRGTNAYQGTAQQPASRPQPPVTDIVDGKPPRGTSSRTGPNWQEEDPYGTLQYINRRAVESVLTYQHQKPGGSTSSRVRTLSQGGPGSVGSRSSNSSLESATEQLARAAGALPPRPALPEALRVEIPGDNVSLGSHKDSGYRSGSSGGGDRNSASSMSSVSVDSPGSSHVSYHPHQQQQVVQRAQYGQPQHPQLQQTMAYANPETKSHSSTDSLSSGQSGQSYATVRAAHGQPQQPIPPHPQQQPPPPPRQQQQQPPPPQQQQQQQQQQQRPPHYQQPQQPPQYPNQQYPIPTSQYQNQHQQQPSHVNPYAHRQPDAPSRGTGGPRAPGGQRPHPPPAEDPQGVIFKAESLMEELNLKEKVGDLPAAMAVCTQAISCLQQAINNPNTSSETKAYLRMKHNTCLLRSRSLHVRLTASHESVSASDLSAEDHGSISSQSTDGDVRDLIDSPQHRNHQPYHHYPAGQHFPAPGSAVYEQQYSSDSGYSSHSMEVTQQQLHMSHSYTDGAIADHRLQQQQQQHHQQQQHQQGHANRDWNVKSPAIPQKHDQAYEDSESNNKSIEMYATLPRKRTPKTKMLPAMPVRADKDKEAEVYQVYLQRQKEAAHQRQQEGVLPHQQGYAPPPQQQQQQPPQHVPHQQGYAPPPQQQQQQPPQHARQTSNSKMNKEQIKHLLIHDFMARKEGKAKDDVPPPAPQPEVKQEHNRIRHMLTGELSHQMKGVSIKDAKRAQSELNLHQVDQVDYHHHQQHLQQGEYGQQQPHEHPARGYMVHPDCRQDDVPAGVYHSRESSCSSTTTIKAHSRENSLSSPPLSPKQSYSASPAPGAQHPAWRGAAPPQQQASTIDRDNNPPKPSMIGKLDKMHQQQAHQHHHQQEQQWMHQPGAGWQAPGAVTKPGIRKSVSHTQLPMYDNALLLQSSIHAPICTGQADWTARSEGDVTHTEGVPPAMPVEMTGPDPAEFDCEEQFPPPPPDMLHFDDDEPLPPPPPELLHPHLDHQERPETKTTKPVISSKPKPPPKPIQKAGGNVPVNGCIQQQHRQQKPQLQHSVSDPVSLTQHTSEPASDKPSSKRTSSVSALVANIEGGSSNTMAIHRKPPHAKMKPQQTNCTFSTFFAPPDDANSGDRSSLSSVDSNSLNGLPPNGRTSRAFESDSSSCQASTGSNLSTTDGEPGAEHTRQQPKRPRSAMKKKREGRERRKSVTFSDNVALVVDQEEVAQSQAIDYIQYVSKVLEQSKRPKSQGPPMGQNHERTKVPTDHRVVGSGGEPDIIDPAFPNGYDSDFDEDTASSASSTDGGDAAQTRCSLCSKKVVEVDQLYCVNCKLYMSRFQPTNTPGTPAS